VKEPKRLLARGATDFERQLLASVMNERPSALLRSRMQRGLGLVGPLAWASNVKAMFSSLGSQATVGVAALGVVAAGTIGAMSLAPISDVALREPAMEGQVMAAPAQSVPSEAAITEVVAPAALAQPGADVETVPAGASSQLRDEIALLDAARSALQQGSRKRALGSLNEYQERFPDGILEREARLLRRHATRQSARQRRVPSSTGQRRP
jgi:hypothetical protein